MQASLNAELQQKYIHLSQLYETESSLKWKHLSQIEELSEEVKKLREEVCASLQTFYSEKSFQGIFSKC